MRIRRLPVLLFLAALLLGSRQASASVIFISQDDNEREFTFDRGDALEVSLPATSGTGYTWQAEPVDGGFVKQVGEPAFALDSAMPGASGRQIFHFAVGASGTGILELRYIRPWEKGSKPGKVFKIMFIVR
jgi:predicted secreted protein